MVETSIETSTVRSKLMQGACKHLPSGSAFKTACNRFTESHWPGFLACLYMAVTHGRVPCTVKHGEHCCGARGGQQRNQMHATDAPPPCCVHCHCRSSLSGNFWREASSACLTWLWALTCELLFGVWVQDNMLVAVVGIDGCHFATVVGGHLTARW